MIRMKVRYRYRFYPSPTQATTLTRTFGACRFVYNWALRLRTDAWTTNHRNIGYGESSTLLTALKRQQDTAWLNEISSVPTQQALRHLHTAFQNFWQKQARFPTFKRKRGPQSAEYTASAFRWDPVNRNLRLAKLGRLDIHWSRTFDSAPTTITITKTPAGRYFVTLCLEEPAPTLHKTSKAVGIDLGVSTMATLSNGTRIPNLTHLGTNLATLKRRQRILSRRTKGSGRWHRARLRVARLHEHIANLRADHLHKTTTNLVRRFDTITIENLNVRGMTANHCLARAISDVGMGMFRQILTYKCAWYGKTLKVADRFFPSSKRCCTCGYVLETLPLDVREWTCPQCGAQHDREINAAQNLLAAEGHFASARGEAVRRARAESRARTPRRSVNQPTEARCA